MALYCGITDLDKRVEEVSAALHLLRRKLKCFFCCCLFLLFNLLLLAWVLISLRDIYRASLQQGACSKGCKRLHGRLARRLPAVG